jgi:uncharacterized FlaG/YvyC family protein
MEVTYSNAVQIYAQAPAPQPRPMPAPPTPAPAPAQNGGRMQFANGQDFSNQPVERQVEYANLYLLGHPTKLDYQVHEATGQLVISLVNVDTQEIIREIPPERTLDALAQMWARAGLFVDERR